MKMKRLFVMSVCSGIVAAMAAGCASSESRLSSQAKISKVEAKQIALAKVPNGTIKEAELEKEKGLLIWSFDIATPGTRNITEVNVDAVTGKIVAMDVETPEKEKAEAEKEKD